MKIYDVGYNHKHDSNFIIDRPEGVGNWLLLIIKTPAIFCTRDTDNKEKLINANSFVLFEPYYPHYYRASGNTYCDGWCHFIPDEDDLKIINKVNLPVNKITDIIDSCDISVMMRSICYEFYSFNPYKEKTIGLCFHQMIYKLGERVIFMCPPANIIKNSGVYFEKLMWIRECIYRNPGKGWSIDEFAKFLMVSRSRFQHLYSQTFGVSIMKDIITGRMAFACTLLRTTDISINEVSRITGYNNPTYFMGKFKEKIGVTPSLYRDSNDKMLLTPSFFNNKFIL